MTKTLRLLALSSAVACLGFAGTAFADEDVVPEGYERTGEMRNCLSVARIDQIDPITDDVFLIEAGSETYLNEVGGTCNGASRAGSYLQYKVSGGQLCSGQIIFVKDNGGGGFTRGSCGLGQFELLRKTEADSAE